MNMTHKKIAIIALMLAPLAALPAADASAAMRPNILFIAVDDFCC